MIFLNCELQRGPVIKGWDLDCCPALEQKGHELYLIAKNCEMKTVPPAFSYFIEQVLPFLLENFLGLNYIDFWDISVDRLKLRQVILFY
jgi:hypothetical protein